MVSLSWLYSDWFGSLLRQLTYDHCKIDRWEFENKRKMPRTWVERETKNQPLYFSRKSLFVNSVFLSQDTVSHFYGTQICGWNQNKGPAEELSLGATCSSLLTASQAAKFLSLPLIFPLGLSPMSPASCWKLESGMKNCGLCSSLDPAV